jgi:hypothetical protein
MADGPHQLFMACGKIFCKNKYMYALLHILDSPYVESSWFVGLVF